MNVTPEITEYFGWLSTYPKRTFFYEFSAHRTYDTDESAYDSQYNITPLDFHSGKLVIEMLDSVAPELTGICLEIGCGTGRLTAGLLQSARFERHLITDASEKFLTLTHKKLMDTGVDIATSDFGLFNGDDFNELGFDRFALIALRSVIHHITDYRTFFTALTSKLKPGGVIAALEPRAEFFLMTSIILGFLPHMAAQQGAPLTESELGHIRIFEAASRFYLDRKLDKSLGEDKYAFATEELTALASDNGLVLYRMGGEYKQSFADDFFDYLKYCMSFPDTFVEKVRKLCLSHVQKVDDLLKDLHTINAAEWLLFRKVK